MDVLAAISLLVGILAVVLLIWYSVRWVLSKPERKLVFRNRIYYSLFVFCAALGGLLVSSDQAIKKEAAEAGFSSSEVYLAARDENIRDPEVWSEIVSDREAEAEARLQAEAARAKKDAEDARLQELENLAKATAEAESAEAERAAAEIAQQAAEEAKRLAAEADCRSDLTCWGEKASSVAMFECSGLVERLARYDYEWTDGFLDVKFSHYRWKDIDNGIVTVIGDKIKFQNGFGAWSHMIYECDVDPSTQVVLDVRVSEGRI